jgi:hypothetical protein
MINFTTRPGEEAAGKRRKTAGGVGIPGQKHRDSTNEKIILRMDRMRRMFLNHPVHPENDY